MTLLGCGSGRNGVDDVTHANAVDGGRGNACDDDEEKCICVFEAPPPRTQSLTVSLSTFPSLPILPSFKHDVRTGQS